MRSSIPPDEVGSYIEKFGANFADSIAAGVAKIAERDPVTAAAMIAHFPESSGRDQIIQPMVATWSRTDPESNLPSLGSSSSRLAPVARPQSATSLT